MKTHITELLCLAALKAYKVDFIGDAAKKALIKSKLEKPKAGCGEIAFPSFLFVKDVKERPNSIATRLGFAFVHEELLKDAPEIGRIEVCGPYLNFFVTIDYLAQVLPRIASGSYLANLPGEGMERVMIEYSQPNTHKVFHVGHMRNAALGDSLVRFFEQMGHTVVAANYFGDEGAHVAKCIWNLKRQMAKGLELESIKPENRAEFLGEMYSEAVNLIDLSTLTKYPYVGVIGAEVISVADHPAADAPANWHVVTVAAGKDELVVVCGGAGYKVGDIVAYMPVGQKTAKGVDVVPKDMKGVTSNGIMLARRELGLPSLPKPKAEAAPAEQGKKKKGKKAKKAPDNDIFILPPGTPAGMALTEVGRLPNVDIPEGSTVIEENKSRVEGVRACLKGMEAEDPELCALWNKTKKWSLDEFRTIYQWLDCRFDHDFFESEVSEDSLAMVDKYYKKGVLVDSNGAVGMDLKAHKLGFCLLRKSNGSGLYATKDLALAERKFEQFNIDRSIYIVDASQSLHFQQVFKTLELMGYEQAKKCFHLPYGLVTLPEGKMSSRKGSVIFFSALKQLLKETIRASFLDKYVGQWEDAEIDEAEHLISVATIKYGMLNHDTNKDIVFSLDDWTARTGNTGPYLMYAYARIQSILREVKPDPKAVVDYNLLASEQERLILIMLNDFWSVVEAATKRYNPSPMCNYLFDLAKALSSYYESSSIKRAESPELQATRLVFVAAIGDTLKKGLNLLGIKTLERM